MKPELTKQEKMVICMVARNVKREVIAGHLDTSVRVVDNILGTIYTKIGKRGIIPLVHFAIKSGLTRLGDCVE